MLLDREARRLLATEDVMRRRLLQLIEDIRQAEQIAEDDRAELLDRLWLTRSEVERTYNSLLWLVQLADHVARHDHATSAPDDVYDRTSGASRLPGHVRPGDVPEAEKIDYPDG